MRPSVLITTSSAAAPSPVASAAAPSGVAPITSIVSNAPASRSSSSSSCHPSTSSTESLNCVTEYEAWLKTPSGDDKLPAPAKDHVRRVLKMIQQAGFTTINHLSGIKPSPIMYQKWFTPITSTKPGDPDHYKASTVRSYCFSFVNFLEHIESISEVPVNKLKDQCKKWAAALAKRCREEQGSKEYSTITPSMVKLYRESELSLQAKFLKSTRSTLSE